MHIDGNEVPAITDEEKETSLEKHGKAYTISYRNQDFARISSKGSVELLRNSANLDWRLPLDGLRNTLEKTSKLS